MFDTFQGYSDNLNPVLEYGLPNQSNSFSDHLSVQPPQVPYSAPFEDDWDTQMLGQHLDSLERTLTRNDPSRHRPKKPVTGVLPGYSSDSDTDSMVTPLYNTIFITSLFRILLTRRVCFFC